MSAACAVGRLFSGLAPAAGLDWEHPCPEPGWATVVVNGRDGFAEYTMCYLHYAAFEVWFDAFESGELP